MMGATGCDHSEEFDVALFELRAIEWTHVIVHRGGVGPSLGASNFERERPMVWKGIAGIAPDSLSVPAVGALAA